MDLHFPHVELKPKYFPNGISMVDQIWSLPIWMLKIITCKIKILKIKHNNCWIKITTILDHTECTNPILPFNRWWMLSFQKKHRLVEINCIESLCNLICLKAVISKSPWTSQCSPWKKSRFQSHPLAWKAWKRSRPCLCVLYKCFFVFYLTSSLSGSISPQVWWTIGRKSTFFVNLKKN